MKDYLNHIYNEIISQKSWEKKYKTTINRTFDKDTYEQVLPKLKNLFTKLNGGTFAETVIVDYQTKAISKLNAFDTKLIPILSDLGYTVSKESYLTGKVTKDNKEINVIDILSSFNSKIKTYDQLQKAAEQNPGAKKQLDAIDKLKINNLINNDKINISRLSIYNNNKDKEYKIVFTMDQRAIASQSTSVGWRSCMNLNSGMYRDMVGSGISAGVFIAYLVQAGDEFELNDPKARVLIKPRTYTTMKQFGFRRRNKDRDETEFSQEMVWDVEEKAYPEEAPEAFKQQVQNIIKNVTGKPKEGLYSLSTDIYDDTMGTYKYYGKKNLDKLSDGQLEALLKNKAISFKDIKNPSNKIIKIAIKQDRKNFKYIKVQTPSIMRDAIEHAYENEIPDLYKMFIDPPESITLDALGRNGEIIKYIENPSQRMINKAIQETPQAIRYIKNPSEKLQILAIEQDAYALTYIKNPSEKVQLLAMENDPNVIEVIDNPSEEVQEMAIDFSAYLIKYIKNPSEKIKQMAVQSRGDTIQFIKNPSEEVQQIAVSQDGTVIRLIKNPSDKVQWYAVKDSPFVIKYIKNPSEKIQKLAVETDGNAIKHIQNASEEIKILAVKQNGNAIQFIKNPSEEIKKVSSESHKALIKRSWRHIKYITDPSEEIQMLAVRKNKSAIDYIDNPTAKVKRLAKEKARK